MSEKRGRAALDARQSEYFMKRDQEKNDSKEAFVFRTNCDLSCGLKSVGPNRNKSWEREFSSTQRVVKRAEIVPEL